MLQNSKHRNTYCEQGLRAERRRIAEYQDFRLPSICLSSLDIMMRMYLCIYQFSRLLHMRLDAPSEKDEDRTLQEMGTTAGRHPIEGQIHPMNQADGSRLAAGI
jgi:hypothetical protein